MKVIYTGWPTLKLAPDLAVEDDKNSRYYGWLFAKHPDGQWVTLADVRKALEPAPATEMRQAAQGGKGEG